MGHQIADLTGLAEEDGDLEAGVVIEVQVQGREVEDVAVVVGVDETALQRSRRSWSKTWLTSPRQV